MFVASGVMREFFGPDITLRKAKLME